MRVGMVATRLGDVDGVSFEALKWHAILREMGHEVFLCAGSLGPITGGNTVIPELHFAHPDAAAVTAAAFDPASDPAAVRGEVERQAARLEARLGDWVYATALDALVVENASAIPMHVPLGVALARLISRNSLRAVGHNHDYWWERERFATCVVPDVLDEAFPPDLPTMSHASINSVAAAELRVRRGLDSTVVPNVFDFDHGLSEGSEAGARQLRDELAVPDDGYLFVQPTRVVPRKGIELAIELVARAALPRSVLLITSPAMDEGIEYLRSLLALAARLDVDLRHEPWRFRPSTLGAADSAWHPLADAYIAADVITYPSRYEGFGNALVESIYFRKLTVVNRYPVYDADIRPLGLRLIELRDAVTDEAIASLRTALADPLRRAADAEHNFRVAREHLGYDRLRRTLRTLLEPVG